MKNNTAYFIFSLAGNTFKALAVIIIFFLPEQLFSQQVDTTGTDSIEDKRLTKKIKSASLFGEVNSDITLTHIYGLPEVVTLSENLSNYRVEGNLGVDILKLPFTVRGRYNSYQSVTGINSFFTVELNSEELKRRKDLIKKGLLDSLQEKRSAIQSEIFKLKGKELYSESEYTQTLDKIEVSDSEYSSLLSEEEYLNSLSGAEGGRIGIDTLDTNGVNDFELDEADAVENNSSGVNFGDSLRDGETENTGYVEYVGQFKDSIYQEKAKLYEDLSETYSKLEGYRERIKELEESKKTLDHQIEFVNGYGKIFNLDEEQGKSQIKRYIQSFLSNVNRLQIGLATPNNSRFLLRGLPLLGFHVESEIEDYYVSVSAGRIYNPRIRGISIEESSGGIMSMLGFPAQSIQYNGIQLKGGYGGYHSDHFHIGWLGARSSNLPTSERHSVIEVDTRLMKKWLDLSITGATSMSFSDNLLENQEVTAENEKEILKKSALYGKVRLPVKRTKTVFRGNTEYFGPEFFSPGLGFQRAGIFTYKVEAEQKIFSKTSVSAFYGQERDALLLNQVTQTVFKFWGLLLEQRIGKYLEVAAQFSPLQNQVILNRDVNPEMGEADFLRIDSVVSSQALTSSYLANLNLSWSRRFDETRVTATSLFQHYKISNSFFAEEYNLISSTLLVDIKSKWNALINNIILLPSAGRSNFEQRIQTTASVGYLMSENLQLESSGSYLSEGELRSFGFGAGVKYNISSNLQASLTGEKIVADAYVRDFLSPQFNLQTPYRIITSLKWIF